MTALSDRSVVDSPPVSKGSKDKAMPLSTMSMDLNKRDAKTKPLSSVKKARISTDYDITAAEIVKRVSILFPECNAAALPCMSSRLFASFTLVAEALEPEADDRSTRRGTAVKCVLPLLDLLKAMVHVESTSLGRQVENRKVQFAAFDGSSTKPPKDNVIGSHIPREESIQALEKALNEVDAIIKSKGSKVEVKSCLKSLIDFLAKFEDIAGCEENQVGDKLRSECAAAMPFAWHAERFGKAAFTYHDDLVKIKNSLERNKPLAEIEGSLQLEKQLGLALGQGIRFHLRRFFNPMYFKVSVSPDLDDKSLGKCNTRLSKISEMLEMRQPEGYSAGGDTAVADGSISSVFSLALQAVDQYFGHSLFLDDTFIIPNLPSAFCTSSQSQQGIGGRRKPVVNDDIDIDEVLHDISEAQRFLTAAKACQFLIDLINWPGVKEEIRKLGGWGVIENYAVLMRKYNLTRLSPDDSHFVVLASMERFLPRAEECCLIMKPATEAATKALDGIWAKFECGSRNRNRRIRYPQIATIEEVLEDGLKMHMFPSISEPTPYNEESTTDEKI